MGLSVLLQNIKTLSGWWLVAVGKKVGLLLVVGVYIILGIWWVKSLNEWVVG